MRTQAEETAKTMKITPTAMMALTAPSEIPLPSRQMEPNLVVQISSTASGCDGSTALMDSRLRLQEGCPYACRACCTPGDGQSGFCGEALWLWPGLESKGRLHSLPRLVISSHQGLTPLLIKCCSVRAMLGCIHKKPPAAEARCTTLATMHGFWTERF